jgi:hypothetical protein
LARPPASFSTSARHSRAATSRITLPLAIGPIAGSDDVIRIDESLAMGQKMPLRPAPFPTPKLYRILLLEETAQA